MTFGSIRSLLRFENTVDEPCMKSYISGTAAFRNKSRNSGKPWKVFIPVHNRIVDAGEWSIESMALRDCICNYNLGPKPAAVISGELVSRTGSPFFYFIQPGALIECDVIGLSNPRRTWFVWNRAREDSRPPLLILIITIIETAITIPND